MKRATWGPAGEIPRIAVLMEINNNVRRGLILGINRYSQLNGPWNLRIGSCAYDKIVPNLESWHANGIIGPIPNARIGQALLDAGIPTIATSLNDGIRTEKHPLSKLSEVSFDAAMNVAKLATEHFLERHFRNFAFVGLEDVIWSERRRRAFSEQLAVAGFELLEYRHPVRPQERAWALEQDALTDWIRDLPTPIAILACNDEWGRMVVDCCRMAELQVPEQVAVLGIDNDDFFCNMADPPLSSVALGAEDAGYEVAALLDAMMRGRVCKPKGIPIKAIGIVTRQSTDVIAVSDREVYMGLRFIRDNVANQISVAQVADAVAMSRRALERRFRQVLGRTILDEIQLARLTCAKRLLLDTNHTIDRVAELSGFGTANYFVCFFRKQVGKSPSQFRGKRRQ